MVTKQKDKGQETKEQVSNVLIGSKDMYQYILNAISRSGKQVKLLARGKSISKAVDIAQVLIRDHGFIDKGIAMSSMPKKDGHGFVSEIEILIEKHK